MELASGGAEKSRRERKRTKRRRRTKRLGQSGNPASGGEDTVRRWREQGADEGEVGWEANPRQKEAREKEH
jgi:hypothetical protein